MKSITSEKGEIVATALECCIISQLLNLLKTPQLYASAVPAWYRMQALSRVALNVFQTRQESNSSPGLSGLRYRLCLERILVY